MRKDKKFKSGLAFMFEEFETKLKTEGRYGRNSESNLHSFDNYIQANFPNETCLKEDMLEWLKQRETEKPSSCLVRIGIVINFLKYALLKGWIDKFHVFTPKREESQFVPHIFSHEELCLFFKTCDDVVIEEYNKKKTLANLLNKFELPVFYRLMLMGAFRPIELKEIRIEDVNVDAGIFFIRKSKNKSERIVVLDDSAIPMLKDYLQALRRILPDSELLFPDPSGNQRSEQWQSEYFNKIWGKISDDKARAYDFRHTHITINISTWEERSYEFDGRLVILMKYVGHSRIQQTAYYFHYTPMLVHKLKETSAKRFRDLCPTPPISLYD